MSDERAGDDFCEPEHESSPEQAWKLFEKVMRMRGLRITPARQTVFDRVFQRHDHFSVDQLADDLARSGSRVAHSTIYSTMGLLAEIGLVREIGDRHGSALYEHIFGHSPHEHMICEACGMILEFVDKTIRAHVAVVCKDAGFVPRTQRVTVLGVCRKCHAARENAM